MYVHSGTGNIYMRTGSSIRGCYTALAILVAIIWCIGCAYAETGETLPDSFDWANAGITRADAGDYEGAIGYYDKALEDAPGIAEIHYNRAVALEHLGRQEEAISEYQTAIEIDPNLIQAHFNLFLLTADIINPLTIAIIVPGACILAFLHHRHRKKDKQEHRVMQGITHE